MPTGLESTQIALRDAILENDTILSTQLIRLLHQQESVFYRPLYAFRDNIGQSFFTCATRNKNRVIEDALWEILEKRPYDFHEHLFNSDMSAFWAAACTGNHYTLDRLIRLAKQSAYPKAYLKKHGEGMRTPLSIATENGYLECCKLLLAETLKEENALEIISDKIDGESILHRLCDSPNINLDMIALFINLGINFKELNAKGKTPIALLLKNPALRIGQDPVKHLSDKLDELFTKLDDDKKLPFWTFLKSQEDCVLPYKTAARISLAELARTHLLQNPALAAVKPPALGLNDTIFQMQRFTREDISHINHALEMMRIESRRLRQVRPTYINFNNRIINMLELMSGATYLILILLGVIFVGLGGSEYRKNLDTLSDDFNVLVAGSIIGGIGLLVMLLHILLRRTSLNIKTLSHSDWKHLPNYIDANIIHFMRNNDIDNSMLRITEQQINTFVDDVSNLNQNQKHAAILAVLETVKQRLESLRAELVQQQKPLPGHFRLFNRREDGYSRGRVRIIEVSDADEEDGLENVVNENTRLLP